MIDILEQLGGPAARPCDAGPPPFLIVDATGDPARVATYRRMRRDTFVEEQGLFQDSDLDDADADGATRVLAALDGCDGRVLGGVRLERMDGPVDLGWWRGSRLVCRERDGLPRGAVGAALVRAACATASELGALRFDACVQVRREGFFARLGWEWVRPLMVGGVPHVLMRWPVDRFERLVSTTKRDLGPLVGTLLARDAWRGDDCAPIPGSDVVATVDAITPSMVERDPEWAGWCGMLVTAHDLAAIGARPIGALDAVGAVGVGHAETVLRGVRRGSEAFSLPILGGHTQLGVPASLSVTGFGETADPVPAGGGRAGDEIVVSADLSGGWRPGYRGRQWDSSTGRSRAELAAMLGAVRECRPRAAKDVSMAGIGGTVGMLAEACGCGAELDLSSIPRPAGVRLSDWLTCFPGYGVVAADGASRRPAFSAPGATSAGCGTLVERPGVRLRWPDGEVTVALADPSITGLGRAA